ncbi:hypothetical protein [Nonomuraea sp. NPDC050310]|uniref:hypothetical protein n=1 Tax=Nonomuraea sp. NPDC050310 TaxID=3154935 RepID=UPI0034119BCA
MRVGVVLVLLLGCLAAGAPQGGPRWLLTLAWPGEIRSLAATGGGEAWLLGRGGELRRWDGRAWGRAAVPARPPGPYGMLVASPAGDDLWLFGAGSPWQWAGGRWVGRPFPRGPFYDASYAVPARDRVWVGEMGGPEDCHCVGIRSWDGTRWVDLATGGAHTFDTQFALLAPPWVVNHRGPHRWDGTRLHPASPPVTGCGSWEDYKVEHLAARAGEAWVVAVSAPAVPTGSCAAGRRELLRWDGTAWIPVAPPPGLGGVSGLAVDGGGVWLAGGQTVFRWAKGREAKGRWVEGRWRVAVVPGGSGITRIVPEPGTGRLWVAARDGTRTLVHLLSW